MQQPRRHLCPGVGDSGVTCCHGCGLICLLLPGKSTAFTSQKSRQISRRSILRAASGLGDHASRGHSTWVLSRADRSSNCNKMQVISGFNTCLQQLWGSSVHFGLKPWPAAHRRAWGRQVWGSRPFPPSSPLPAIFPGSGEGRVGAFSPAPANSASGQRSSRARWSPLLLRPPLPDSPCLTQGGFSPGLGGGKDVKQAFP